MSMDQALIDLCHVALGVRDVAKAAALPRKFLNDIISKSFGSDAELYGEVPKEVMTLAKQKY